MTVDDDDEADESALGVIKMKLNTFCRDGTRRQLVGRINKYVLDLNRVVAEAYLFANFHIAWCLSHPTACELPKLDRNFYYRCILAVATSNVRRGTLGPELMRSIEAFDALRPVGLAKVDVRPYNQAIADLSIQMATMACNSVWAKVEKVVMRYLRFRHPNLRRYHRRIVDAVVSNPSQEASSIVDRAVSDKADTVAAVIERLRSWYRVPGGRQFNTRAHLALPLFHAVLAELSSGATDVDDGGGDGDGFGAGETVAAAEAAKKKTRGARRRRSRPPRLFSLLPRKKGFTLSYVPISSMSLMRLLSTGDAPMQAIKGDGRAEDHRAIWDKFFNVKAVETRNVRFDERILTDGKGVSIQRCRRVVTGRDGDDVEEPRCATLEASRQECRVAIGELEEGGDDRLRPILVGVDPGMADIVTCATSDGQPCRSFSSGRFSEQAGYNVSRRRTTAWNNQTEAAVRAIPSPNTADLAAHATAYLAALPGLLLHRAERGYRSMRFFRYVGKQKTVDAVCDLIAPRHQLAIVGFGNWSNLGHGIRRSCSGPVKDIKRRLSHRPNVLFRTIDEFRSSCLCSCCHGRLTNMRARSMVRRRVWSEVEGAYQPHQLHLVAVANNKVHKVLHCRNSVESAAGQRRCGATWNRDVNASKNLLSFLRAWIDGEPRPAAFLRGGGGGNKSTTTCP